MKTYTAFMRVKWPITNPRGIEVRRRRDGGLTVRNAKPSPPLRSMPLTPEQVTEALGATPKLRPLPKKARAR